jgi:hypothetical protein
MEKGYRTIKLNSRHQALLEMLVREHGNTSFLSPSQLRVVRPVYNRMIKNPAWKIVAARKNDFDLVHFALHIADWEIIANHETFLWYLFDRYGKYGQVSLNVVAEHEECVKWHYEELVCWLNGLSAKYFDIINFSSTHDYCAITFKKEQGNETDI